MRMIMAIDEAAKVSYSNNMPACMRWAQRRAAKTGNTVKILLGRPAPSVSLVVQLAISPEFNQFGAAWEHSCHVIPKSVKPPC